MTRNIPWSSVQIVKSNRYATSDVAAGTILGVLMLFSATYYVIGAIAIATGHSLTGSDLTGVQPTDIPDFLRFGVVIFIVVTPMAVAYMVWMLVHTLSESSTAGAVIAALVVACIVGLLSTVAALFALDHILLGVIAIIAGLGCLGFVYRETSRR